MGGGGPDDDPEVLRVRMQVSHPGRFVFVHVPRTGGTSWEEWACARGWLRPEQRSHGSAREAARLFPDEWARYLTFAFVRDPWSRLASAYAFEGRTASRRASLPGSLYAYVHERVAPLLAAPVAEVPPVLRPQAWFVCDDAGRVMPDVLGRFESLEADAARVMRRLGVSGPLARLPRSNASPSSAATAASAFGRDPSLVRLVGELYGSDVSLGGYDSFCDRLLSL